MGGKKSKPLCYRINALIDPDKSAVIDDIDILDEFKKSMTNKGIDVDSCTCERMSDIMTNSIIVRVTFKSKSEIKEASLCYDGKRSLDHAIDIVFGNPKYAKRHAVRALRHREKTV